MIPYSRQDIAQSALTFIESGQGEVTNSIRSVLS